VLQEIGVLLDDAAAAWNRGDLDGFVSTYAVESTTTFVSGGEVQYGFDWIRANYAPRFQPDAARDSLRFEDLETRPLGQASAMATAHYVLFQADSVTDSGIFTLILRRTDDGWLMIHDHTSR
jgi:beta-aspartyl-peptidase (threonine type)